jgi:aminopeptidase N
VQNPINNYNITLNIGDYVHFSDKLNDLDIDYWVLRENEEKAKKHFEDDVKPMLECFQEKFGDYPFAEDSYKLVETPYLGMEHQSAIAYGNRYTKGYLGNDISGSGVGKLFDFIIIHETGHEWFGNSITSKDIADMWIHESFTTYSEAVYVECRWGYEKAMQYINGQSRMVENQKPIVGQFGVNFKPKSTDMYYKGALMLNTIRHIINDDEKWWKLLLDYSNHFKHQIIEARDVIDFFTQESGINLRPVFEQYLYYKQLPQLHIEPTKKGFIYYWKTDVKNFEMPVEVILDGKSIRLQVTNKPQTYKTKSKNEVKVSKEKFFIQY